MEATMAGQPEIRTERLLLRPFALADAPIVQRLAGDREIAATTLNIPHPYEDGMAEEWIDSHPERFAKGEGVTFAVVRWPADTLIGAIGLGISGQHQHAELGYWIGKPYWNDGYCTEAAGAVLRYGFAELGLNRIYAQHMGRNPASGRVMEKVGMQYEGCLRQHFKKWGVFEDVRRYGILRSEYRQIRQD
jgi:ribosomal-protein-alanine N-acetyltransferase